MGHGRLAKSLVVLLATGVLAAAGGCVDPRVTVDTRLAADSQLWSKLDGPRCAVTADDPGTQAMLAFQEAAGLWTQVLTRHRPELRFVDRPAQADLVFTLYFNIIDLGTGVSTYPVYGWSRGYAFGWGGRVRAWDSHEVVGTEVQTYHLGFKHTLFASAWVPDAAQPAGRRVIWEGQAERIEDQASLKAAMPYLTAGLGRFYGQATSKPTTVKVHKDDLPGAAPAAASTPVVSLESTSRPS